MALYEGWEWFFFFTSIRTFLSFRDGSYYSLRCAIDFKRICPTHICKRNPPYHPHHPSGDLHCITAVCPLESTPPHEPKLYPPTKVKTTDKYTSTQKYKIQKCRTEYRIKKQIEKILEILYWGAGHPHRGLQNPESRIQQYKHCKRHNGPEALSF